MPQMTKEEMIDTTMIYSAKGLLKERFTLINKRPFRAPSLAITAAGMFGGGIVPKPGEISLAHHGVLFLDEFPEYARDCLLYTSCRNNFWKNCFGRIFLYTDHYFHSCTWCILCTCLLSSCKKQDYEPQSKEWRNGRNPCRMW